MFCDKCGKRIEHSGTFCEKCKENVKTNGFLKIDLDAFSREEARVETVEVSPVVGSTVRTNVTPKTDALSKILNNKKNYVMVVGCAAFLVVVAVVSSIFFLGGKEDKKIKSNEPLIRTEKEIAREYLEKEVTDIEADFDSPEIYEDNSGSKYYRYQRIYKGIPVYGDIMVVALDKDNNLIGEVQGEYREINIGADINTIKGNKDKVIEFIENTLNKKIVNEPELVVYYENDSPVLAWCADVYSYNEEQRLELDRIFIDIADNMVIGEVSNIITDTVLYYKEGDPAEKKYTYVSDDKGDITIYDKIPNNAETVAWFLAEKKDFEKVADDDIKNELLDYIKELQKEYFVNFEDELSVYVEDCDFENSFYFREPSLICLQFNFELYKNDDINDDIYEEKLQQMLKKEYVSYFIDSVCGFQDSELRKGYTEAITYLMGVSPENYTSKLYSAISEIESKIDSEKDKEKLCELLISSLYMMTPESDESICRMAIEILNSNTYDFDKSVISEAFKNAEIEWINIKEPEKEEPEETITSDEEEKLPEPPKDDRPDRGAAKPDREDNKTPWNRDNEEKFDDDDKR